MTVLDPMTGELFLARTEYYHSLAPFKKYSITNGLAITAPTTYSALVNFANVFADFLRRVMKVGMVIDRTVVSTWYPDTSPYDGNEYITVPHGVLATNNLSAGDLLPLKVALFLRKKTLTGRTGKMFIRGSLRENEVSFGQELFSLTDFTVISGEVEQNAMDSNLSEYFLAGNEEVKMAIITNRQGSPVVRPIMGVEVAGVRTVSVNHRYYDK